MRLRGLLTTSKTSSSSLRSRVAIPEVRGFGTGSDLDGARSLVEELLAAVPPRFLGGLQRVVVGRATQLAAGNQQRSARRDERTVGVYHHATKWSPAWIEILVDRIYSDDRRWRRLPIVRELALARVLFHEVGHHVHREIEPRNCPPEKAAEHWKRILMKEVFRKRRPLLRFLAPPVIAIARQILAIAGRPRAGADAF